MLRRLICAAALSVAIAGCSQPAEQATPVAESGEMVSGAGEIVAVTREYNAVTIRHEAIPEYRMGAMTMEFTVTDPALLNDVSVGDTVTFELSGPLDIASMAVSEDE